MEVAFCSIFQCSPVTACGSRGGAWWRRVKVRRHVVVARVAVFASFAQSVSSIPVYPVSSPLPWGSRR